MDDAEILRVENSTTAVATGVVLLGLRTRAGPQWFSLPRSRAREMGRMLLNRAGENDTDETLEAFRAARADARTPLGVVGAAERHGIDPAMLAAWLWKLQSAER